MQNYFLTLSVITLLLPLLSALFAGCVNKRGNLIIISTIIISLIALTFMIASYLFWQVVLLNKPSVEGVIYSWLSSAVFHFDVAILLDRLSATMIMIVSFVSLMVHVYSIGYMKDDHSYTRFFSYVSLFTFAMLVLVLANNFLLMFFGWEGVGLVSYLLIGFWFKKESAVNAGLKAFLVNRVGDIGFILGIAAVLMTFGSLNYHEVFAAIPTHLNDTCSLFFHQSVSMITLICFLLFIGAMGKSAQMPLHVWLPDSMEGPTPISALIHAATMVTAGIYMVARTSPLFEYATPVLIFITVIGATTALLMGLLALTEYDIKRVIAYSTLSQLGYMTAALGVSAYNAAIFHLITHAFFKALLFLAAGSIIVALHHEQDLRKMGGLYKRMPITYLTFLIGAFALAAIPPFAGFYSKDAIIEAIRFSSLPFSHYAYICVLIGAFLTPLYIFRVVFLAFHGALKENNTVHIKESPWIMLLPLIFLSIPSIIAGGVLIGPMLFAQNTLLGNSIFVLPTHEIMPRLAEHFQNATINALESGTHLTFWLSLFGIMCAFIFTQNKRFTAFLKYRFTVVYKILQHKYGFDAFNEFILVSLTKKLSNFLYYFADLKLIDGIFVNGSGKFIRFLANTARLLQTGYLYHYILVMVLGIVLALLWFSFIGA